MLKWLFLSLGLLFLVGCEAEEFSSLSCEQAPYTIRGLISADLRCKYVGKDGAESCTREDSGRFYDAVRFGDSTVYITACKVDKEPRR
jgi:hypothetical protein